MPLYFYKPIETQIQMINHTFIYPQTYKSYPTFKKATTKHTGYVMILLTTK